MYFNPTICHKLYSCYVQPVWLLGFWQVIVNSACLKRVPLSGHISHISSDTSLVDTRLFLRIISKSNRLDAENYALIVQYWLTHATIHNMWPKSRCSFRPHGSLTRLHSIQNLLGQKETKINIVVYFSLLSHLFLFRYCIMQSRVWFGTNKQINSDVYFSDKLGIINTFNPLWVENSKDKFNN